MKLRYSGKEDYFLWSKEVAVAEELGWDFVNRILSSKMSFSSFSEDISRVYQSSAPKSSIAFLSKTAFISCFFAWCGRMNIDFRKEIDPWCGHTPPSLAGDGTHIGLPHSRLNITR